MSEPAQISVRRGIDRRTFESEITPGAMPVVLEDLVADWPMVRAARESRGALAD